MAKDGSKALGAPELAGTLVNPKGYQKKATAVAAGRVVAGAVGAAAATLAARSAGAGTGAPEMPQFGRVAYLAVSERDLALVKTKFGWKMTPTDEVLALVPRTGHRLR